jgi:hypothetical protein
MSFLDNLENSLKALESQDENAGDSLKQRAADRASALAAAPWAEKLKKGPYTQELLKQATQAGYKKRAKVYIAWLGTTLKLEARDKKLELRPTPTGVVALFLEDGAETRIMPLDLESDPADLVRQWIG